MNSPHDNRIRTDSDSDRKPDSAVGSNERTNERTDVAADQDCAIPTVTATCVRVQADDVVEVDER